MALDNTQVRVAGMGHVYVAAEDDATATWPVDAVAAPGVGWVELGYITTDGCTFTMTRESEDLDSWQGDKIRVLNTSEPMTVEMTLMETSTATLTAALGGGTVTVTGEVATFTPPPTGTNTMRKMILDFNDGDDVTGIHYRYLIYKVQVEGDVSWQLLRTDSLNYPITWGILSNDPHRYIVLSDDPALIPSTALAALSADVETAEAYSKAPADEDETVAA